MAAGGRTEGLTYTGIQKPVLTSFTCCFHIHPDIQPAGNGREEMAGGKYLGTLPANSTHTSFQSPLAETQSCGHASL